MAVASHDRRESAQPVRGAWIALSLLLAINLFNYIDRQMLSAVEPDVQRDLLGGVSNPQAKMGLLSGAFTISYMIAAPIFGLLAERYSRWWLIALSGYGLGIQSGFPGLTCRNLVDVLRETSCVNMPK